MEKIEMNRLNILSYPFAKTGYGEICRDFLMFLSSQGEDFGIANYYQDALMNGDFSDSERAVIVAHEIGRYGTEIDVEFLTLKDLTRERNIAITMYEAKTWTNEYITRMKRAIVVPNAINYMVCRGVVEKTTPVFLAPLGVDLKRYRVRDTGKFAKFTFILVSTWSSHKNILLLIDSFRKAEVDADLVIHCPYPRDIATKAIGDYIKKLGEDFPRNIIVNIGAFLDKKSLVDLFNRSDVFITMSSGEGRGVFLQAMACGLPCIVPSNVAVHDYTSPRSCWYIPIEREIISESDPFVGAALDYPSQEGAIELIRNVVKMGRDVTRRMGQEARSLVESLFSSEICFRRLLGILREIKD